MTTSTVVDAPLLDLTDDSLARPLPAALHGARADVLAAAADLLAIPEASLTRPWDWIGGGEEEVRYGAYRAFEALELAETASRALLASQPAETHASTIVAAATAARWDLHGLLLRLAEHELDADPGGGEWTIRLTLGHIINGQRAYGWGSAWWAANAHDVNDPGLPPRVPESLYETLPDEATIEAAGTREALRERLDGTVDLSAERLAGLPDDRLGHGARWSGFPVTIGFRLGRWSSHIREHALQIEKTLAMLQRTATEPERLTRLVLGAYGRAEAVAFGRAAGEATDNAARRVAAGAREAREALRSARAAAEA